VRGFRVARTRVPHEGPKMYQTQEAEHARSRERRSTAAENSRRREARRTAERDTDLTQVRGPREEVKPLLLPSCIAPQWLARYTRSWLQSSS
jgi:hypothetical protein